MNKKIEYIKAEAKIVYFANEDIITASVCQTEQSAQQQGDECGDTHKDNCDYWWLILKWVFERECSWLWSK